MNFTPGPWTIVEYGKNPDGTPKFYGIMKGSISIANLGYCANENAANARLISAAPELLGACKNARKALAVALLAAWEGSTDDDVSQHNRIKELDTVIAKATAI